MRNYTRTVSLDESPIFLPMSWFTNCVSLELSFDIIPGTTRGILMVFWECCIPSCSRKLVSCNNIKFSSTIVMSKNEKLAKMAK